MDENQWQFVLEFPLNSDPDQFHNYTQIITDMLISHPTYTWIGMYWVYNGVLYLGAWKGPAATDHTAIPVGQGICGLAAYNGETIIVPDVSRDPRYLQCFLDTKSEIVVPIYRGGNPQFDVIGEIDIDGDQLNAFNEEDRVFLEYLACEIGKRCPANYVPHHY